MTQYIADALINGVLVALGLFALWSFVGRMRDLPAAARLGWAAVAGGVSFVVTLIVPQII
jgi:hypothetical protein